MPKFANEANFGAVAKAYARYRDELPESLLDRLETSGVRLLGLQAADLGAGSGIFSRALARRGAIVDAVEPSQDLIAEAIRVDRKTASNAGGAVATCGKTSADGRHTAAPVSENGHIVYHACSAEQLDLPSSGYGLVAAVRAWHWFDRGKTLEQVRRLLAPEGYLLIVNSVFVPERSDIAGLTLQVAREAGIDLKPAGSYAEVRDRRSGFPVNWFGEWSESGLAIVDEWQEDYELAYTADSWCGKIGTVSWMTTLPVIRREAVLNILAAELSAYAEPFFIPHRYSAVLLRLDV